jgi:hypothetical protein
LGVSATFVGDVDIGVELAFHGAVLSVDARTSTVTEGEGVASALPGGGA